MLTDIEVTELAIDKSRSKARSNCIEYRHFSFQELYSRLLKTSSTVVTKYGFTLDPPS